MASVPNSSLTEGEYLRLERQAQTKSEFHDGQMFAMAGGSPNHSLLANSIGAILHNQVGADCRVFNADLRIKIPASNTFTYADCSVLCGEPQFSDDHQDGLLNPLLVVEVLSPSSESYDRGKKFELYRTMESFCEYLLVHQDRRRIEHYSRQADGSWLLRENVGAESSVVIIRLGVRLALADLYASALGTLPE